MTIAQTQSSQYRDPDIHRPIKDLWHPEWTVDVGQEITVGIAKDDGCYVVLSQLQTGQWNPMTHIPVEAAKMLGRLAGG